MAASDFAYMSLLELGTAFKTRKLSPVEITRTMIDRTGLVYRALLSYVTVMAESAMLEAKKAQDEISRSQYHGPMHGVPVAVNDLCDAEGVVTIAGMPRIYGQNIATKDSTVVAWLRAAGAVILGKLQLTEGAVAHHHPDVKPPINPHNPDYWSGASSSGSGVATAAGLCYGSLGSNTRGSIRFPCFANGVTGIKPTWCRVSRAGVFPLAPSLDHIGPMAHSAGDCGAILNATGWLDHDDPTTLRAPPPDCLSGIGLGARGVRIGFDEAFDTTRVDPLIVKAMRDAIDVFKSAGAKIKPIKFPSTGQSSLPGSRFARRRPPSHTKTTTRRVKAISARA